MKKYLRVTLLTIQEILTYRFNFFMLFFRNFVSLFALVVFWNAVYSGNQTLFGYQPSQIMSYVIGVAFLRSLVLSSKSADLAGQIRSGELSRMLSKPWNTVAYYLSRDVADKVTSLIMSLTIVFIITKLFSLTLFFPTSIVVYLYIVITVILSMLLYLYLSLTLSALGFWTEDIWATRWLFGIILLEFMAGVYFPIDILPKILVTLFNLTPFPYLIYFPIKIWNQQIAISSAYQILLLQLFWLSFFYLAYRYLWRKGIKRYGACGG